MLREGVRKLTPGARVANLLVRIHFSIVMVRWTGLAPWEFEFLFAGSLTSTGPALLQPARQTGEDRFTLYIKNGPPGVVFNPLAPWEIN